MCFSVIMQLLMHFDLCYLTLIKGYYPSPLICCGHGISTVNKKAADIFKVGGLFSSFIHHVFSINSSVGVHSKFSGNRVDYLNVLKPPSSTRNRLFFLGTAHSCKRQFYTNMPGINMKIWSKNLTWIPQYSKGTNTIKICLPLNSNAEVKVNPPDFQPF